ncbi:MAG: hypothetical protein LVS60_06305 [Nodosilinea sp. LVE1205-7]
MTGKEFGFESVPHLSRTTIIQPGVKIMLKNKKMLGILIIAVLIVACNYPISTSVFSAPDPSKNVITTNLDRHFQLKMHDIAWIQSESLKIQFLNIDEDSRCPSEVQCPWNGQVSVIVNIAKADKNIGDFKLIDKPGSENQATINFDGYSIRLLEVMPYPKTAQRIRLSDYTAILVVSRK